MKAMGKKPRSSQADREQADAGREQSTRVTLDNGTEYDAVRCARCKGKGCEFCRGLGFTKEPIQRGVL